MQIDPRQVTIHWTHKKRIKELYKDGFSIEELSIGYKLPYWYIKSLTRGVERMERI